MGIIAPQLSTIYGWGSPYPAHPVLYVTIPLYARRVQVDGRRLYIAAAEDGVQVFGLLPPSVYLPVISVR